LRLKKGQSLEDFIAKVEEKVNAMVGESTLNEYKSFKALMKHKKRVNRVFSDLGAETSLHSRPPCVDKKIPAITVATCSVAPPKAPRRKGSDKGKRKSSVGNTSSSIIRPEKTKTLESNKRKHKASEDIYDAEVQVASSLAQLGQKKAKKAVKKIVVATVQRVPSAFSDDEMTDEPRPTGFSSCLWCDLRFGIHRGYSLGSENEFVDVDTFSDDVLEVQAAPIESVAAGDTETGPSQASAFKDRASPKFTKDLELTVQKYGDPVENPSLIERREELPEGQDPSPSVAAYNENFGTSFRGELLSVRGEVVDSDDGAPRLSLLWTSPEFMDETREDARTKKLRLTGKTPSAIKKHPSLSL
jgi:hypothetical protein